MESETALGDRAAVAHAASWRQTHARWGRGWLERHDGFVLSVSDLAIAPFNGASVYGPCDLSALREGLDRVAATGLPHILQCRPAVLSTLCELAGERGMHSLSGAPLMVCESPVPSLPTPPELSIRQLSAAESHLHAAVLADAFDAPLDVSSQLVPEQMLAPANVWTLIGECDGQPVSTAYVDVQGDVANLHNIGTREAFRGRGFGAAITAAALQIAADADASFAMLLSSTMAIGVYERLGFREIEYWSAWESCCFHA